MTTTKKRIENTFRWMTGEDHRPAQAEFNVRTLQALATLRIAEELERYVDHLKGEQDVPWDDSWGKL